MPAMEQLTEYVAQQIANARKDWDGHPAALDVATWRDLSGMIDAEMRAAVKRARDLGATWQNIADVFGTTRSSAQQRFRDTPGS